MCDSCATIMRTDVEILEAECRHYGHAVASHSAFGVFDVGCTTGGFGGRAIAAEVEGYDCVSGGELGSNEVPDVVRLGETV